MPSLRLPAFAKINLGVRVLGRRPDGYHELRTVYQTIGLHDRLTISLHRRGSKIEVRSDDPDLPTGPDNLVHRASEVFLRETGIRAAVGIVLEKRIPVGRGLGGGSSNAAVTLLALAKLAGRRLSGETWLSMAAQLGSDVAFFLLGGRALGVGRGEEVFPLPDAPPTPCLVVSPEISVPTAEAYRWLSSRLTSRATAPIIWGFCVGCWSDPSAAGWISDDLQNDFEPVVFARYPQLATIKKQLKRQGALVAALTGSGSALFGLFASREKAQKAARAIQRAQALVTQTVTRAQYWRRLGVPREQVSAS
jgi:4-diphosphocytidyl-2-C-methyl-D-erythritol kinase